MADGGSLINFGDITKPATVLIEKISDAIGGLYYPYQIRRIAKAEAEAEKIRVLAGVEITEIQERGLLRLIKEEGNKQRNIEQITKLSLQDLRENAKPQEIDNDWLVNFFDKCRLVSNTEMQSLWARLLAGEANQPGTFSKRTIQFVSTIEKSDANLFTSLCTFAFFLENEFVIFIHDIDDHFYSDKGINFTTLTHLDDIGLITFNHITQFSSTELKKTVRLTYFGMPLIIEFPNEQDTTLDIGPVILTKIGQELASVCGATKSDEFLQYKRSEWQRKGYLISSPMR